jgi:hypothetical protein
MGEEKTTGAGGRQSADGKLPNAGAPNSTPVRDVVLVLLGGAVGLLIEWMLLLFFD